MLSTTSRVQYAGKWDFLMSRAWPEGPSTVASHLHPHVAKWGRAQLPVLVKAQCCRWNAASPFVSTGMKPSIDGLETARKALGSALAMQEHPSQFPGLGGPSVTAALCVRLGNRMVSFSLKFSLDPESGSIASQGCRLIWEKASNPTPCASPLYRSALPLWL